MKGGLVFNDPVNSRAPEERRSPDGWRCVLVGAEALLVDCAQQLEARGHSIVAVVSKAPAIANWAAERGPLVADSAALLAMADELGPIDYLFSITNLDLLGAAILSLPTRGAINFHDGPLPERAGVNAPAWALLEGASEHGITWHLMTGDVDAGAVLCERRFPIAADETALSLNRKCFAAASESFRDLLDHLAAHGPTPVAAGTAPLAVHRKADRPARGGAIAWDQPVDAVCRLVRALDFGGYANPLVTATASFNGLPFIVQSAMALPGNPGSPGEVVRIDADAIVVSATDGLVAVGRAATMDGSVTGPLAVAQQLGLSVGCRLDTLDAAHATALHDLTRATARNEAFWSARLLNARAIDLPGIDRLSRQDTHTGWIDMALANASHPARIDTLLAAAVGWLARLADADHVDVGYAAPVLRAQYNGVAAWFAPQVPISVDIDFSAPFATLCDAVVADVAQAHRCIGLTADLLVRQPALRARGLDRLTLSTALIVADDLERAHAEPGAELTLAFSADGSACRWFYDAGRLSPDVVAGMQRQFAVLLAAADADPERSLGELPLIDDSVRNVIMVDRNATAAPVRADACIHMLIEEQVRKTPDAVAVICGERAITYAELDRAAEAWAQRLRDMGIGPDKLVGVYVDRSIEMVVGVLGILKAGGAYLPLDPAYPAARIEHMLIDSGVGVVLTQHHLTDRLPRWSVKLLCLDTQPPPVTGANRISEVGPANLAYVIYTSGSTGQPKGVMVEHRNVVNFFAGMDARIEAPGTWLAVTSLSFDISVLELCWTLTRGFTVVLYTAEDRKADVQLSEQAHKPLDFSLFYFASDAGEAGDKYKLLLEGAKYADREGFSAVWTPERHFHAFGGLYPNPAVTSAAVAAITSRVKIRAGSVVMPLHHPIRVAEDWSLVDNLSGGRAEISFAAGWQPNDFVLAPDRFKDNKAIMLRDMDVVRKLWRGESVAFPGPLGKDVETSILPRPIQPELPVWLTSAGNVETFEAAGRAGANVLTHLLGQTIDELEEKLAAYRVARAAAGHAGPGRAAVMLHSFVGPDADAVRAIVRAPLIEYLRTSASLIKQYAWSFPAFKRREGMTDASGGVELESLSEDEMAALLEYSFERYFETSGLFGTPADCMAVVDRLKAVGADEVACLIDFGIDSATVLAHLPYLNTVRRMAEPRVSAAPADVPTLLVRHRVTHLQCTPSMASLLLADGRVDAGLARLNHLMVGGEALPPELARELCARTGGRVTNMYGPTETTIWSTTAEVTDDRISLGIPLANQEVFILDRRQQPVPDGFPGELVIGGAGVTRGYLNRPELTAERFVPHPLRPGEKVYRTGDLARWRADGTLEFLGRLDNQVKIRGHRIELGEIEAALASHPAVREVAVVAREDLPGDTRLVAYIVAAGIKPADELLFAHLRDRLSDAMLPQRIMALAAMPRTPNGKLDRKALPAPTAEVIAIADAAPMADGVQARIAEVWRNVLKLPSVGINDNFFDIGGHSLLAVQVHRQLCLALDRKLAITDVFRFPTIKALSDWLARDEATVGAVTVGLDRADARRAAMGRRRVATLAHGGVA
jgi:natural product biosynthesis luciferase-like monooxygenase protein